MKVARKGGQRAAVTQLVKAMDGAEGRVGWFESAKYADGKPVAGIAYVQEFGSAARSIPPRSYFRTTAEGNRNQWAKDVEAMSRAAARGKFDPNNIMEGICLAAEGQVRATITKLWSPELHKKTVAARVRRMASGRPPKMGIKKPLVDSGLLLATLTSQVTKK